jgi:hypothetical protein
MFRQRTSSGTSPRFELSGESSVFHKVEKNIDDLI